MSPQSPDQDKIILHAERRRQRLLYSLNDLQQALSACEFLYECEETMAYSKIELRRFRCYETTLVVAYTRPFSQSRGAAAPLSMKMVGLKLSNDRQALHDRLMDMRNKIMAHSDTEMMRMTTQSFDVSMREGEPPVHLIQTVFDEGITLLGALLIETNELLQEIYQAVYGTLHKELQANPELFNIRIDSEAARAARNLSR
ncbi:MAG: hypothetical protein J0H42_32750 [Rhizobiales bacterium]|nr:hypothetical protein [Hyphomicrobiales bacterium]